jgi:hypothetical protein
VVSTPMVRMLGAASAKVLKIRVRGAVILADLREIDHRSAGEVASERGALSSAPIVMS